VAQIYADWLSSKFTIFLKEAEENEKVRSELLGQSFLKLSSIESRSNKKR